MANHEVGNDIFVYTGGQAPRHVVNAIIDESVEEIDDDAFSYNEHLKSVVCHDGVLKVKNGSFEYCSSLQRVKMPGVKIIEDGAFFDCRSLVDVELDKLETIGSHALDECTSLQRVKLPKVKIIGRCAFMDSGVEELEFGEYLETIGSGAFRGSKLRRIAIPLKDGLFQLNVRDGMFQFDDGHGTYTQFHDCPNLATIDLVGGIHKTVASLHLESWRDEMNEEIQRINQVLLITAHDEKTDETRQWMQSVSRKIDRYKAEHRTLLKEVTTLLELALWKAKFENDKGDKHSMEDVEGARKEACITSGADIVIKNVLPFLMLVD